MITEYKNVATKGKRTQRIFIQVNADGTGVDLWPWRRLMAIASTYGHCVDLWPWRRLMALVSTDGHASTYGHSSWRRRVYLFCIILTGFDQSLGKSKSRVIKIPSS